VAERPDSDLLLPEETTRLVVVLVILLMGFAFASQGLRLWVDDPECRPELDLGAWGTIWHVRVDGDRLEVLEKRNCEVPLFKFAFERQSRALATCRR